MFLELDHETLMELVSIEGKGDVAAAPRMNERGYSEGTMKLSVERETEGRPRETGDKRE